MRIKFKNLGRIEEGDIEIKPLTIFLNNYKENIFLLKILYSVYSTIREIPERDINFIVESSIRNLWNLKSHKVILEKLFNIKDDELRRLLNEINKNVINYTKGKLSNTFYIFKYSHLKDLESFKIEDISLGSYTDKHLADIKESLRETIREYEAKKIALINIQTNPFKELFYKSILTKIPYSFYIPSSRNGLILGADFIIPNLFSRFRKVDVELTKGEIDFLRNLYFIKTSNLEEESKNNLDKFLNFIEERIFKGKIVKKEFINRYRTFELVKDETIEYPLHLIKNSFLSLLPIYLFIKYIPNINKSIFLIDEIEAHLSLYEQFEVAKLLTLGTNLGINFVLTTNSEYILFEIGNFVNISKLKPLVKTNYLIENNLDKYKECVITEDKVVVYNIKELDKKLKIESIDISEFGINPKSNNYEDTK